MLFTSSAIIDIILFGIIFLGVIYKYLTRNFDYWKKAGVYHLKPLPLFGNLFDSLTYKTTVYELIKSIWDQTDDPYFGMFFLDEPVLVLKCPKLIKDVLVKDFSVFCDRRAARPTNPNMSHSMFFLKYNDWKKVRAKISPMFSTGMLKYLFHNLEDISTCMVAFLNSQSGPVESKHLSANFSTEMIARCTFAADPHCFDNENSEFLKFTKKVTEFNMINGFRQNMYFIKPAVTSFFGLNFIEKDAIDFYADVFKTSMAARTASDGKAMNFVDMGHEAIKQNHGKPSDALDAIISNAILVVIAAQETTSSVIAYTLYELAMNHVIQDKLRSEIKRNLEKYGKFTLEGIEKNLYLRSCIKETLRKYPALPFLDRIPVSDYKFNGTSFVVKKGTSVIIPFFALHRDENYYPNANKYDPDRFLDNSINLNGLKYIPFGDGPRDCIGKRLGMLGASMAVAKVLMNFRVDKNEKTPKTIDFEPKSFPLVSKQPLYLTFTPMKTI